LKRLNDNGSLLNVVCSSIIYEILSAGHLDITIIGRVRALGRLTINSLNSTSLSM